MNALETSDRRLKFNPAEVRVGHCFGQGYFLEETAESVRLDGVRFAGFGILNSHFEGGQWLGVVLDRVDLACVRFRHVYFEGIDFSDCTFASVHFDTCVFAGCTFAADATGLEKTGCYEASAAAPAVAAEREPQAPVLTSPATETVAAKPAVKPAEDRFDRIER